MAAGLVGVRRPRELGMSSKLVRIVIQLPADLKMQLDSLKQQGYTTSGFIRAMLERELAKLDLKPLHAVPNGKRAGARS